MIVACVIFESDNVVFVVLMHGDPMYVRCKLSWQIFCFSLALCFGRVTTWTIQYPYGLSGLVSYIVWCSLAKRICQLWHWHVSVAHLSWRFGVSSFPLEMSTRDDIKHIRFRIVGLRCQCVMASDIYGSEAVSWKCRCVMTSKLYDSNQIIHDWHDVDTWTLANCSRLSWAHKDRDVGF